MKFRTIVPYTVLSCLCVNAIAQETATSASGDAKGVGGTVAYSLGQVFYTEHSNLFGTISKGVQHAFVIYPAKNNQRVTLQAYPKLNSLSVFPNPTANLLTLHIKDYYSSKLSYSITDISGNLLHSNKVMEQNTQIETSKFIPGIYFVNVYNEERKIIQSFKVLKKYE